MVNIFRRFEFRIWNLFQTRLLDGQVSDFRPASWRIGFRISPVSRQERGFTLMEVLIASTIFAMVMLITTGVVAQSSTSRAKLKTQRETSEETRKLADLLTREIRSANASLTVSAIDPSDNNTHTYTFKNGLAILNCGGSSCDFKNHNSPSVLVSDPFGGTVNANALVLATKENIKIYYNSTKDGSDLGLYYRTILAGTPITSSTVTGTDDDRINLISAKDTDGKELNDTKINFGGFCPQDDLPVGVTNQQPYVRFFISSRTKGYDNQQTSYRAMTKLRTIVTSRSYNN